MTKPPETRNTVFFGHPRKGLAVFAANVVDVEAKTISGVAVDLEQLPVGDHHGDYGTIWYFWVLPELPRELQLRLSEQIYVAQSSRGYTLQLPDDKRQVDMIRSAQNAARAVLFPERYKTPLAAE